MKYVLTPVALVLGFSLASTARAEGTCAETFPARLAAAKADVTQWMKEDAAERKRQASPDAKALTFFEQHCRVLTELERAVRKLDDPLSFVCDPAAGPKPKALTTRLIAQAGSIGVEEERPVLSTDWANRDCSSEDPIDLAVTNDLRDDENNAKAYLVRCYDDPREVCQKIAANSRKALALIAELKAEGKR